MGKKLGESSSKITKPEKKQLNSLLKVLRPKVYITDSSSFKGLVQELTGNGKTISNQQAVENVTVARIEDHGELPESSPETSLDSSEFGNQLVSFPEELKQSYNQLICFDDSTSDDLLWMNQHQEQEDKLAYHDLESLLPDMDRYTLDEFYSEIYQQEISIYDYELSGLL